MRTVYCGAGSVTKVWLHCAAVHVRLSQTLARQGRDVAGRGHRMKGPFVPAGRCADAGFGPSPTATAKASPCAAFAVMSGRPRHRRRHGAPADRAPLGGCDCKGVVMRRLRRRVSGRPSGGTGANQPINLTPCPSALGGCTKGRGTGTAPVIASLCLYQLPC